MLPGWYGYRTHCDLMGGGQYGKSSLVQHFCQEHVIEANGWTHVDGKGPAHDRLEAMLCAADPEQPVYLLDFSADSVLPFDFIKLPDGHDIAEHVADCGLIILKLWGADRSDAFPTYIRVVKIPLWFCAMTGAPLHVGAKLLYRHEQPMRDWFYGQVGDPEMREAIGMVNAAAASHGSHEWRDVVLSSANRLNRFVGSSIIRRTLGLPDSGLAIQKLIQQRGILLAKACPIPGKVSEEAAKTFCGILASRFAVAGLENAARAVPHFVYFDEAQEYCTDSMASMLDLCLASGLRFTFVHHSPAQFLDRPKLLSSLDTNAQIKVVFGGLPIEHKKRLAESRHLAEINELQVMAEHLKYHNEYEIDETETGRHAIPYVEVEVDYSYFSRDEKIGRAADRYSLKPRRCRVELPDRSYQWKVPVVHDYRRLPSYGNIVEFREHHHALTGAIPIRDADLKIKTEEERIADLIEGGRRDSSTERKPKAKAPTLHPQK